MYAVLLSIIAVEKKKPETLFHFETKPTLPYAPALKK